MVSSSSSGYHSAAQAAGAVTMIEGWCALVLYVLYISQFSYICQEPCSALWTRWYAVFGCVQSLAGVAVSGTLMTAIAKKNPRMMTPYINTISLSGFCYLVAGIFILVRWQYQEIVLFGLYFLAWAFVLMGFGTLVRLSRIKMIAAAAITGNASSQPPSPAAPTIASAPANPDYHPTIPINMYESGIRSPIPIESSFLHCSNLHPSGTNPGVSSVPGMYQHPPLNSGIYSPTGYHQHPLQRNSNYQWPGFTGYSIPSGYSVPSDYPPRERNNQVMDDLHRYENNSDLTAASPSRKSYIKKGKYKNNLKNKSFRRNSTGKKSPPPPYNPDFDGRSE